MVAAVSATEPKNREIIIYLYSLYICEYKTCARACDCHYINKSIHTYKIMRIEFDGGMRKRVVCR